MTKTITDKIDAVTLIPTERQCLKPACPKSVKIELTARCNFKCQFCATSQKLRKQGEMDRDFYCRAVREMREAGVEELGMFFLGESFLVKWLPEAIEYAKKDCGYPYVFITSNGALSTPEKVKACMDAGLDSLKWSYNYADEEQFEKISNVPRKNFHAMINNIKAAHKIREEGKYDCGLFASSIRYNGEQLVQMEKAVEDILPYVDEHYWLPLYSQSGLTKEAMEEIGATPVVGNFGRYGSPGTTHLCFALFCESRITYDGKMSMCCFNHNHEFDAGDMNTTSFMDCWWSSKYQTLRKAMLSGDLTGTACENCYSYDISGYS